MATAHTLVNAYLDLPPGERDAALTRLVHSFGQRERDFVQGLITDTRDPFYNLPIELLIYTFDFLHSFDVWTKRLVCRRWNDVLSSDKFTRSALKRFDTHDPQDSALGAEENVSPRHRPAISHVLALRKGRPFSLVNISDEFACAPSMYSSTHLLRLKGKRIVYLRGKSDTREGNTVVVRNLVSGEVTLLCGTAREKIMSIELTSDIVIFFTHTGVVYVASLLNLADMLHSIRLPSSLVLATSSCRITFACLIRGSHALTAVIHDAGPRRTHSFDLQPPLDPNGDISCCTVLLDSLEQCIDVFIIPAPKNGPNLRVEVSRYSYAGDRTRYTSFTMQHELSLAQNVSIGHVEPTGEPSIHQLSLRYSDGSSIRRWSLIYNSRLLTLKAIDPFSHTSPCDHRLVPDHALWKDRLYRADIHGLSIVAARRSALYDGPHTLRSLPNQAKPATTQTSDEILQSSLRSHTHYPYFGGKEEDEEDELKVSIREDAMHGQPSRLSSWQVDTQAFRPEHFERARLKDLPSVVPQFAGRPFPPLGTAFEHNAFLKTRHHHHTIIAVNDTFAVATCYNPRCIGIVCFDERVKLHGAG